jgi:hypothetical protein
MAVKKVLMATHPSLVDGVHPVRSVELKRRSVSSVAHGAFRDLSRVSLNVDGGQIVIGDGRARRWLDWPLGVRTSVTRFTSDPPMAIAQTK